MKSTRRFLVGLRESAASEANRLTLRCWLRAASPVVLSVIAIALLADQALAQGTVGTPFADPVLAQSTVGTPFGDPFLAQGTVGTPSETPIDEIVEKLRNFLITILLPLVAAVAIVYAAFLLYSGGREGMGNMLKVIGATLAALGAVGLVNLLQAFASGQSR